MKTYLIFGASITYGAWDKEGGWVQRLRKCLEKDQEILIYNLGVSGDNTEDLLERFESETKSRLREDTSIEIIFDIGINDSQFIHSKGRNSIPEDKFKNNIHKLIELARKYSSKIIFIGLTPVDEAKTCPIEWNKNKSYKNEYIKKYNNLIKLICKENNIPFIDIFSEWVKLNYKKLLEDGLHPNTEGHKLIYERIKEFLEK